MVGWGGIKDCQKNTVLRMGLPMVENVSITCDIVLHISKASKTQFSEKNQKKIRCFITSIISPVFPQYRSYRIGARGIEVPLPLGGSASHTP